jgi:NADP-dependent 3-hydroxy acid dehydrogenase YdfG
MSRTILECQLWEAGRACFAKQERLEYIMAGRLDGKVALVTGASSGIGEATALALAAEGAYVAVAARRGGRLEELASHIEDKGGQAIPIIADVALEPQAHDMVHTAYGRWRRLDIVVNNAGVMLLGPIGGADTEDWRRMVSVNVSSVAGRTARAGSAVYNATKWGVGAFSEALRQEVYQDSIRVTVLEPGAVATGLTEHITDPGAKRETQEWIHSIRPLQSEDIAAAIIYAVTQPEHVSVNEILIRPTQER